MKQTALISVMVLMLVACGGDRRVSDWLDRAEGYLPAYPESADMMLKRIDSLWRADGPDCPETDARRKLLRTMTNAVWQRSMKDDTLIGSAYQYYKEAVTEGFLPFHSTADLRHYAQSCYYMARHEGAHHNTKRAEDLFREAIRYAEKAEDWRTHYLACHRLGIIVYQGNAKEGVRLLSEALESYRKCNDAPANYINILMMLSNRYMTIGESEKAFECINEAYDMAVREKLDAKKYDCMRYASVLYFLSGNYEKSLELAKEGMNEVNRFTNTSANFILAINYLARDSLEQARAAFLSIKAADKSEDVAVYHNLCKIAIRLNDTASARCYLDSLGIVTNKMASNIHKTKDDYYKDVIEKEQREERLSHQKWMLVTWIVVILLFLVLFIFYQRRTNRLRRQAWLMKRKHEIETHNMYIMEQKLQHENDQMLIHQKSITSALLQKLFLRHLAEMKANLEDADSLRMSQEIWKEMEDLLDSSENGFVSRLRQEHKDFGEDDIQLCMLTRMKVKNKIMADIFHISVDAVKKRKSTLKKNGFGIDDPNITLEQIIEALEGKGKVECRRENGKGKMGNGEWKM